MDTKCSLIKFYQISDVEHTPVNGAMFIHYWASIDRDKALIDCMADSGLDALLVPDFFGNTTLHYAAACSAYAAASFLVGAFRSQHFFNMNMITPSHLAAMRGDTKMLELLTKSDVMMDDVTRNNWSNLHFAIFYEQCESVKYILENCNGSKFVNSLIVRAEVDVIEEGIENKRLRFCSPLDLAKTIGNMEIVNLLIRYNALPSLHAAVVSKDMRGISFHLFSKESRYFKNLNLQAEIKKCTPLHLAAANGDYRFCNVLIQNGASVGVMDENGFTPLDLSIIMNYFKAFSVLLLKADIECLSKACFIAGDLNRTKFLSALVKMKLDLNYVNKDGDNIIIHLLKRKMDSFVLKLLSTKPNLDFKDAFGLTVFHYSALVSSKLISAISDFDFENKDKNGVIPFSYALLANNEVGYQLLKDKSNYNLIDSFGMSPIIYSFFSENSFQITSEMVKMKYTINIKKFIESEIKIPSKIKFFNYLKMEDEEIQCDFINIYSKHYETVVNSKAMSLFLEKTDGILHEGTLLHIAILFNLRSGIVAQMLDSFPDLVDMPDNLGRTPLHLATMLRKDDYVAFLINRNASLFHKDKENNSLFHFIDDPFIFSCFHDISNIIQINSDYVNNKGETPIHLLCKTGSIQVLKLFITIVENQSIFSLPDNEGNTPLDLAFKAHSQECVDFLHSVGAQNKLIMSIRNNDIKQLSLLIKEGYDVNSYDKTSYTPLHTAVAMNSIEITKFLLNNGADVKSTTANGLTPLHVAAQQNNFEICCLLLEQDIKLTERLPEEQPYLLATEPKIYSFLLHFWKRQHFILKFFDFNYNNQRVIGLIKIFLSNLTRIVKNGDKIYNFVMSFKKIIQSIEFVSSKIRAMKTKRPHQFNYMKSIHHLLMILTIVDIKQYIEQFQKFIIVAESTLFVNPNFECKSLDSYLIFLFPMQWYLFVEGILEQFRPHLLPEIDDFNFFNSITNNLQQSTQIVTSIFNLVQDKIIEQLPFQPEKDSISSISQGYINASANCVISNIRTFNQYIFIPQNYLEIIHTFSNCYELPRTIPFENKEHLHAIIKGNYFIISNQKESFLVPFFFINTQISIEGKLEIITLIGSFTLTFNPNDSMYFFFKNTLFYQSTITQKYDFGERGAFRAQNIYKCFVVFQLRSETKLRFHTMNVLASQESECFDICYSKLNESLQAPPVFFNIMPINVKTQPGSFTVIQ